MFLFLVCKILGHRVEHIGAKPDTIQHGMFGAASACTHIISRCVRCNNMDAYTVPGHWSLDEITGNKSREVAELERMAGQ